MRSVFQYFSRLAPSRIVAIGTLVLLLPAILNGGPFVYFDSGAYMTSFGKALAVLMSRAGAEGGHVVTGISDTLSNTSMGEVIAKQNTVYAGRSIYYSILAFSGLVTTVWLPIVLQCLVLSWLVVMLYRHLLADAWAPGALLALAVLAGASSAALFANLIMPDIWAGLAVLALALLWTPQVALGRAERLTILLVLGFSALVHNSHLALIAVMCMGYALLRATGRVGAGSRQGIVIPATAVAVAVCGNLAFGFAVETAYGSPPLQRPHVTAHLVELGPGTAHARSACPAAGYALCEFEPKLPVGWIPFLFSRAEADSVFATASPATQRALASEQLRFARDTIVAYPFATLGGLAFDGVRQLWTLSVDDVPQTRATEGFLEAGFPAEVSDLVRRTLIYNHPELVEGLTRAIEIVTLLSAAYLAWAVWRGRGAPLTGDMRTVAATLLAGLVLNAMICGVLASPYGRFQARIVWLLPLLAVLVAMAQTRWSSFKDFNSSEA